MSKYSKGTICYVYEDGTFGEDHPVFFDLSYSLEKGMLCTIKSEVKLEAAEKMVSCLLIKDSLELPIGELSLRDLGIKYPIRMGDTLTILPKEESN